MNIGLRVSYELIDHNHPFVHMVYSVNNTDNNDYDIFSLKVIIINEKFDLVRTRYSDESAIQLVKWFNDYR